MSDAFDVDKAAKGLERLQWRWQKDGEAYSLPEFLGKIYAAGIEQGRREMRAKGEHLKVAHQEGHGPGCLGCILALELECERLDPGHLIRVAGENGIAEGERRERGKIVAWLRTVAVANSPWGDPVPLIADAINNGDHAIERSKHEGEADDL